MVDVHLNWLNWFCFLILEGDLLVILIDGMNFLLRFQDVTRMLLSTVPFLAQLAGPIPESKGVSAIFQKKGQKRAKFLKIWAKMYKI